jgi:ABC-type antimicrobial peptide transport system permease subunit
MLGIIIGVTSVVVIMSVGAGAQGLVLNQVKSLGSNLVGVLPGKSDDNGPPASVLGIIVTTLTTEDSEAFVGPEFPYVSASTPYVRGNATFTSGDNQTDANYVGVAASYPLVEEITVANGRFFTAEEDKGVARVAVLGSETAEKLFGDLDPVGRLIKIKRVSFRVIGVVEKRGVSGFQNQDNQIFVPVTTAQKLLLGINYVNFVRVKVSDAQYVDQTIETMKEVLRARHDIDKPENDDFSVRSTNQGLEALTSITNALKFFLAAIAAISLIVGGIGIMNIMLAAVEERTKEIGLRKAVGATNRIITLQFLIETITITFVGGVIGIILGTLISVLVATVARSQGYVWDLVITPSSIILGCSVSIAIGLIFGITPARRASRLSPIEALRYE